MPPLVTVRNIVAAMVKEPAHTSFIEATHKINESRSTCGLINYAKTKEADVFMMVFWPSAAHGRSCVCLDGDVSVCA